MYYINVSQLDCRPLGVKNARRHVFGTRDDIGYSEAGVVLQELRKRFPESEGYKVEINRVTKSYANLDEAQEQELLTAADNARALGNWPKL